MRQNEELIEPLPDRFEGDERQNSLDDSGSKSDYAPCVPEELRMLMNPTMLSELTMLRLEFLE